MFTIVLTTRRKPAATDCPRTLYYSCATRAVWGAGLTPSIRPKTNLFLLLLLSRPGRWVSFGEVVHVLWGDDPDGGPDGPRNTLQQHILLARPIAKAFGFALLANHGRGYGAVPIAKLDTMPTARNPARLAASSHAVMS